jgi:hypothetical protein
MDIAGRVWQSWIFHAFSIPFFLVFHFLIDGNTIKPVLY